MAINIKNNIEQEKMRTAGRLASEILTMIDEHVKPGATTKELDEICHNYIVNLCKCKEILYGNYGPELLDPDVHADFYLDIDDKAQTKVLTKEAIKIKGPVYIRLARGGDKIVTNKLYHKYPLFK